MAETLLSQRLKELRKLHNYTQDYVASMLGVVRQTYSHYETGKRTPNSETLYKLSGLYNVPIDDFMHLTIELDKNIYYDAPAPSSSSIELTDFLEYFNNPNNKKNTSIILILKKNYYITLKKYPMMTRCWLHICKLRLNGTPVPLLRNGYSIFNGTKYR